MEDPRPNEPIVTDPPQMSEVSTVLGIFMEPGRVFEDLRRKPRFVLGGLIIALLVTGYGFGLYYKVGEKAVRSMVAEQIEKSPQTASMSAEQKNGMIEMNMTIQKYIRYAIPIFLFISFVIGGLCYFLGSKAFGGSGGFMHAVSVWIYSSIPPTVVAMIANFIVIGLKSADEIDLAASQRGVIQANPSFLLDGKAQPVLATIVGTFDLFMIWGWILAAIGLRITNRISSGSAWGIVLIFALLGILGRVVGAFFSGNPS
jgi:hypothetical protein